ncbi:MAG: metallophosphoesterase family protein [Bryobacteraceae bacterium]
MKILILSDLHANLEALRAINESWDELWVLGDVVNYGPSPVEVLEFVRRYATLVVRGNHDHALGYGADPRCAAAFREMARAMQDYTAGVLSEEQKRWLRELPLTASREVGGESFLLCHAAPRDPLYSYLPPDPVLWGEQLSDFQAATALVGHTHLPLLLETNGCRVVNPGSVGQPKHGVAEACYAVWQDGRLELNSRPYDVDATVRKVLALPVEAEMREALAAVLRSGQPPFR